MKQLNFDKKYYNDILNGKKTQTTRLKYKDFIIDEIVEGVFRFVDDEGKETKKYIPLCITRMSFTKAKHLNREDNIREGLGHMYPSIISELRLYYPDITQEAIVCCIEFKVYD